MYIAASAKVVAKRSTFWSTLAADTALVMHGTATVLIVEHLWRGQSTEGQGNAPWP